MKILPVILATPPPPGENLSRAKGTTRSSLVQSLSYLFLDKFRLGQLEPMSVNEIATELEYNCSSIKGLGDAVGKAKGGLQLARDTKSMIVFDEENRARCLHALANNPCATDQAAKLLRGRVEAGDNLLVEFCDTDELDDVMAFLSAKGKQDSPRKTEATVEETIEA